MTQSMEHLLCKSYKFFDTAQRGRTYSVKLALSHSDIGPHPASLSRYNTPLGVTPIKVERKPLMAYVVREDKLPLGLIKCGLVPQTVSD